MLFKSFTLPALHTTPTTSAQDPAPPLPFPPHSTHNNPATQTPLLSPSLNLKRNFSLRFFQISHKPNLPTMKLLTVNFLTCAIKTCKTSPLAFPLHFRDAELERSDIEYNPRFLANILPRLDWEVVKLTAGEVGCLFNLF